MGGSLNAASVVVTGGTGFIGSHLVEKLVTLGARVTVVSRTGNARYLGAVRSDITLLNVDLCQPESLRSVMEGAECLFHLAAWVPEIGCAEIAAESARNNVLATVNICEAARMGGVKKIVYASTRQVYGSPITLPVDEEHPTRPDSFYGAGKLAGEHFLRVLAQRSGISAMILRYSGVYGPREEKVNGTIPHFIARTFNHEPIRIQGSGEQVRNYTYVQDIVEATVLAASLGSGLAIYNVGGVHVSIKALAESILSIAGSSLKLEFAPSGTAQHDFTVDSAKIERELGFKARTPLEVGLQREIEWYSRSKAKP